MGETRMTTSGKYMFETAFETLAEPKFSEEDILQAREEAMIEGVAAGIEKARGEIEQAVADVLTEINHHLGRHEDADRSRRKEAAALALVIARKLAGVLVHRQPLAEIEALIGACVKEAQDEPRIVVRVADALLDDLSSRVETIKTEHGFAGEIVVLGEDSLEGSDCRVEWADGGAERGAADIDAKIDAIIERFMRRCDAEQTGEHDAEARAAPEALPVVEAEPVSEPATDMEAAHEPAPEPLPASAAEPVAERGFEPLASLETMDAGTATPDAGIDDGAEPAPPTSNQ